MLFSETGLTYAANEAECEKFGSEELIFKKNSVGSKYYVVLRGICQAYYSSEEDGQEVLLARLQPLRELREGDSFGEAALVLNNRRETTVISKRKSVCLSLDVKVYQKHLSVEKVHK